MTFSLWHLLSSPVHMAFVGGAFLFGDPTTAPDLLEVGAERREAAADRADLRPLDAASLKALTDETSVRFATRYFADRVLADAYNAEAHAATLAGALAVDTPSTWGPAADWTVVFVPGADTGDLGQSDLAALGFVTRTVPHDAGGDALVDVLAAGGPVLVVSAHEGTARAAEALDGRHVAGWVNVATAAADLPAVDQMQLVPAPLLGDLPRPDRKGYRALAERGPNDGATLLADQVGTGLVVPLLGTAPDDVGPFVVGAATFLVDRASERVADDLGGTVSLTR
jgi:hypothetical protein